MGPGSIGQFPTKSTGDEPVRVFVPHSLLPEPLLRKDDVLNQAFAEAEKLEKHGLRAGSRLSGRTKPQPVSRSGGIRMVTGLSFRAASAAMDILVEQGMAREFTGKHRTRLFAYDEYLAILNEGTEVPR